MDRETLVVTGAIIPKHGKVLVARRLPTSRFEPGRWEFPGGKVGYGECPREAIRREIAEEIGIVIEVDRVYDVASHIYSDAKGERHVILIFYLCREVSGAPRPMECAEVRYVSRDEIRALPFVEGDIGVLGDLVRDDPIWVS